MQTAISRNLRLHHSSNSNFLWVQAAAVRLRRCIADICSAFKHRLGGPLAEEAWHRVIGCDKLHRTHGVNKLFSLQGGQLLNLFDKSHEWFTNPSLKMSTAQAENYLMGGADRSEHQCTRQSWPVRLGEMYCPCYIKTGLLSVVLL